MAKQFTRTTRSAATTSAGKVLPPGGLQAGKNLVVIRTGPVFFLSVTEGPMWAAVHQRNRPEPSQLPATRCEMSFSKRLLASRLGDDARRFRLRQISVQPVSQAGVKLARGFAVETVALAEEFAAGAAVQPPPLAFVQFQREKLAVVLTFPLPSCSIRTVSCWV